MFFYSSSPSLSFPITFPSAVVDLCVGFSLLGCTALSYNFPFSSVSIFNNNFCFLFSVIMTNDIFFLYIPRTSLVPTLYPHTSDTYIPLLPRCYDLSHLPPAFSTFILSHSYTLPALLSSTIKH